jgi:hypothetical protein
VEAVPQLIQQPERGQQPTSLTPNVWQSPTRNPWELESGSESDEGDLLEECIPGNL